MTDRDRKQIVAEVNILRSLHHENIVGYVDRILDSANNTLHLVMEYCEGGDLGSVIKAARRRNRHLEEEVIWSYLSQMVLALDACHNGLPQSQDSKGKTTPILHRDLKPENIFLDAKAETIKLGDFGLSKQLDLAQNFASTYVGTPYYMSPELATGEPYNIKSDIWALGCIVYELCTHQPPFNATTQAELTIKIKSGRVPTLANRGYSRMLDEMVQTMLRLKPEQRPDTGDLLGHPNIDCAIKSLKASREIAAATAERKKWIAESQRLEQWEHDLTERENQLQQREAEVESQLEKSSSEAELQRHYQMEQQRQSLEEEYQERRAALEQEWQQHVQEMRQQRALVEEERAGMATLLEQKVAEEIARRISRIEQTAPAARRPPLGTARSSPGRQPIRPPMPPRRISASGDVSMEGTSRRSIRGLGVPSPACRRKSAIETPAKKKSDDGWYDTQTENEDVAEGVPAPKQVTAVPASVSARQLASPQVNRRPQGAGGVANRLLYRERFGVPASPRPDRSDISMKDVTMDSSGMVFNDKENGGLPSSILGVSSAKAKNDLVGRAKRLSLHDSKLLAPQDASILQSSIKAAQPSTADLYALVNDSQLPSPFLRKTAVGAKYDRCVIKMAQKSSPDLHNEASKFENSTSTSGLATPAAPSSSSQVTGIKSARPSSTGRRTASATHLKSTAGTLSVAAKERSSAAASPVDRSARRLPLDSTPSFKSDKGSSIVSAARKGRSSNVFGGFEASGPRESTAKISRLRSPASSNAIPTLAVGDGHW